MTMRFFLILKLLGLVLARPVACARTLRALIGPRLVLGVLCAFGSALATTPSHAFETFSSIQAAQQIGPDTNVCLEAFYGATTNTRIQANIFNGNLAGGSFWSPAGSAVSTPALDIRALDACGYLDIIIVSQNGADGPSYAADDYIGVVWRARETVGGAFYEYEFAIEGASVTTVTDTRTLIGSAPTASITGLAPTVGLAGDSVTVTFSEAVTGFTQADLVVSPSLTVNSFTGSGTTYTFNVVAASDGPGSISIPAGAATSTDTSLPSDAATQVTTNAVASRPEFTFVGATDLGGGDREYEFLVSRPGGGRVIGGPAFSTASVVIENATKTGYLGLFFSTGRFAVRVTPTGGDISIRFLPGVVQDEASGNQNAESPSIFIETIDLPPPTITIAPFTGAVNGPQTAQITLSDPSTDFDLSDLTLTNATATLTGSGTDYEAVLTPQADGRVALQVAVGRFSNAAGTFNTVASNEVESLIDLTRPTPVITYSGYSYFVPFTATITFDEDVTGLVAFAGLTTDNATPSNFQQVSPRVYTYTLQAINTLVPPQLFLAENAATDLAGNLSVAAEVAAIPAPDGVAPVVAITGVPNGFTGPVTATISFDWSETVAPFTDSDITVTGGTLGPISGGPQVWTAVLSVDGDTDVGISVAAGAVIDASGTPSAAASVTGAFASGTVAEELIREFIAARASSLIAAQPGLTGLLDNAAPSGNIQVTRGFGEIQFRTGSEGAVWAALDAQWSDIDGFETAYTHLTFGSHIYLQDGTLLGVMLQLDHAASTEGVAEIEGTGWLVGPYYVARYGAVDVDARLLWGRTENEISPVGTYTDTFATERVLAMVNLSGEIEAGAATLRPLVGWSYVDDRSEAYIDALANPVAAQRVRLSELEVALDWSLPFGTSGTDFTGGIAGIFTSEEGGNGSLDGTRGRVDMGLRRQGAGALDFDIGVYADGLFQPGLERYGVDVSVDWRF